MMNNALGGELDAAMRCAPDTLCVGSIGNPGDRKQQEQVAWDDDWSTDAEQELRREGEWL